MAMVAKMRKAYEADGPSGYWRTALDHTLAMARGGQPTDPV